MAADRGVSKILWQGLALIAIPSLALVGLEIFQATNIVPELVQSQDQVSRTFDVIATAQALEEAVDGADRGVRGFIITGNAADLDPYRIGIDRVPPLIVRLRRLIPPVPDRQGSVTLLDRELQSKLGEMKRTISLRQQQGFAAARRQMQQNVAADPMSLTNQLITAVIADQDSLLQERQARLAQAQQNSARISVAATILAVAIMVLGGILLTRALLRAAKVQATLRESEERFRLLVSGVKDYAIIMLDPSGRIVSWNDGAQRIAGYRRAEIIGSHVSRFYPPEDLQARVPERTLLVAGDGGRSEENGWRIHKDGSRFWANVVVTALRDQNGELRGFAHITRDLTAQREQQEAFDRSQAELAQAQKMEAVGQLTGGVAHDFNNLLTTILGSIDMLQRQSGELSRDEASRLVAAARRAAEQGAALTRRLLAFSRRQTLEPEVVNVNRIVESMTELLQRTLGEGIAIDTQLEGEVWPARVDRNQLESALLNLVINGRDAMPDGGRLTIETDNVFLEKSAGAESGAAPGQYVMIAVSDTGAGMSQETQERAFDPFFTTKEKGKGTGLGLSQVHGFVESSGGHVKLYSEIDRGTTVEIYLPRDAAAAVPEPASERAKPLAVPARGETVLLVEDNPDVREFTAYALADLGYRVYEAEDAAAALRLLDEHKDIRILFTDVGLPGINGPHLAEEARRRVPQLKILFTTGYTREAALRSGVLDAAVDVLTKPFTVEQLAGKLHGMLQGRGDVKNVA